MRAALRRELGHGSTDLGEGESAPALEVAFGCRPVPGEESVRELDERPIAGPGVGLGRRDRLVGQDVGVLGAARRTGADRRTKLGHHELVSHGLARAGQSVGSELGSDLLASHGVAAAEQLPQQGSTALEDLGGDAELAVASRHGGLDLGAGERLDPAQVFGSDEVPRRPKDMRCAPNRRSTAQPARRHAVQRGSASRSEWAARGASWLWTQVRSRTASAARGRGADESRCTARRRRTIQSTVTVRVMPASCRNDGRPRGLRRPPRARSVRLAS